MLLVAILTACGGGGGGATSTALPTAAPSNSPTMAPSSAPSQQPAQSIVLSPATPFDFYAVGAAYAQTILVSEAGYSGTFNAANSAPAPCTGIISITALSIAGEFSLTPIAPGYCQFEFEDARGNESGTVYIEVTTSQVVTE